MTTTLTELITRAALAADMHDNFVTNDAWGYWANTENRSLAVRLARLGFPYGLTTNTTVTVNTTSLSMGDVLAVVGVYEKLTDGTYRRLKYVPPTTKLSGSTTTGDSTHFTMLYSPSTADFQARLYPPPPDDKTYVIDYLPHPAKLVFVDEGPGSSTTVHYPLNWEERIVLGMARRALAREESSNSGIERLIQEIDNHIDTSAWDYLYSQNNVVQRVEEGDTDHYFIYP